jgi:hypothetical protein
MCLPFEVGIHLLPLGLLETVVANQMQILDRAPKNGNGPKEAKASKPAGPVDESDNPFNEPASETADQEVPF